jgi:hypothetical protein
MKKTEVIEAVAMTRKIRDAMYEETKELSHEELLRYIRQRSGDAAHKSSRSAESGSSTASARR